MGSVVLAWQIDASSLHDGLLRGRGSTLQHMLVLLLHAPAARIPAILATYLEDELFRDRRRLLDYLLQLLVLQVRWILIFVPLLILRL